MNPIANIYWAKNLNRGVVFYVHEAFTAIKTVEERLNLFLFLDITLFAV